MTDKDYLMEYCKEHGKLSQARYSTVDCNQYDKFTTYTRKDNYIEAYGIGEHDELFGSKFYITTFGFLVFGNSILSIGEDLTCFTDVVYPRNFKDDLYNVIKRFKEAKELEKELTEQATKRKLIKI